MRLCVAFPLLLAACTAAPPAEREQASPAPSSTQDPAVPARVVALPGEYRVAGVDGREIDQPYAITARVTSDRIHVTADCLNFAWRYSRQGDRMATERVAAEGCARGPTSAEDAVVAAFDAAELVVRTPANAIELRGTGHAVTLFSQ